AGGGVDLRAPSLEGAGSRARAENDSGAQGQDADAASPRRGHRRRAALRSGVRRDRGGAIRAALSRRTAALGQDLGRQGFSFRAGEKGQSGGLETVGRRKRIRGGDR